VRGEVHGVVVELVVVREHALDGKLGHRVDEVVEKRRQEQREAVDKDLLHAAPRKRQRALGLHERQRQREQHKRRCGAHRHANARDHHVARDKEQHREDHKREHAAHRLRDAGQVELVLLLQSALVDVAQRVKEAKPHHAAHDGGHVAVVTADAAVQKADKHHGHAGRNAVDLVVVERVHLVDVRDLVRAHAVVAHKEQERTHDHGHREETGVLGAHELRGHNGEQREEPAPARLANGVAHVVARGLVRQVLLGLLGDAAREDRGDQAVPPVVGDAAEKALLLGLGCAAGAALVPAGARPHERAQTRLLGSPALPARSCHAPTILSRPLGPSFSRPLIIYRGHCIAPRVRGPAPGRIVYVAFRLCGCSVGLTPNVGWLAKVVLHAATCGTRASPSAGPAGA
jgi:hypothetical protein